MRAVTQLAGVAVLGVLSAAAPACQERAGQSETPRVVTRPALPVDVEAGAPDAGVSPDAGTQAPPTNVSASPAPPQPPPAIDPVAWLQARGVPPDVAQRTFAVDSDPNEEVYGCRELPVGSPSQPGLECEETEIARQGRGELGVYRDVVHQRIRVVTAGKPHVVVDAVVRILATDFPDWTVLALALVPVDATTLTLGDDAPIPPGRNRDVQCHSALALLDAPGRKTDANSRSLDALDRSLITRACAARGRMVWSKDRFVLTR